MNKKPLMRRIKTIHFVGIGGSGMSGIAEVLINQGYKITGSDQNTNTNTERLKSLGATIFTKHQAENIKDADAVVVSTAINKNNLEIQAANNLHIPVLPRAQMLAELMRFHYSIAIAGTHGKTTTTSLISTILAQAKIDPTFVIGGVLNSVSANAKLGNSQYFVVEADESDASFLFFNPLASVVTNIDADHMQTYHNSFDDLKTAFLDFLHRLPFYGLATICIDDPTIKEILPKISRPIITYGFGDEADVQICDFKQIGFGCNFKINWKSHELNYSIHLNLPGYHNALNATAAFIIATECCHIDTKTIEEALAKFDGVGRRMERYGEIAMPNGKVLLIDDYGHHPKEIEVTIEAIRAAWPERRLILAFQPHRYSRTQALFEDFSSALSQTDILLLMEIYPASEKPIPGIDSRALIRNIRQRGKIEPIFVKNNEELLKTLPNILQANDILLIQGAGSIGVIAPKLKKEFP